MRPSEVYLQLVVSLLFFHFYLHLLLCLSALRLFAVYVTFIFLISFFHYVHLVSCRQPVLSLCFLQLYSSFSYMA